MTGVGRCVRAVLTVAVLLAAAASAWSQDGRLEYVAGDVWIDSAGERVLADFGSPVARGDVVTTGADGVAVVTVAEGSQIKLRVNTVVEISELVDGASVDLR